MTLDAAEVWNTIDEQRSSLADLLEDFGPAEWETASLCSGWRVRDVAAHLTLAQMRAIPATLALLRARGNFNRMIHDTAVVQAALPTDRYPALLRGMVGSRRKAPGVTHLEPLIDVLVHGQDIAVPLGRVRSMPGRAAAAAATRVWTMGWPFHAERKLSGLRLRATDEHWEAGSGDLVEGPIASILLLLTGRPSGIDLLSGPGVPALAAERAKTPRG